LLAQRLITYEASGGESSEVTESAAFRVCEKLRVPLCALAGVEGFRSLLYCALRLARAEAPTLLVVRVAEDGSLQGLDALPMQEDKDHDQASEVEAILLAHLFGLFVTFIGEGVTSRLVQDVWPEVDLTDLNSEKEKKT
jgi:hypothetical protein